jgi:hypothetical protein
MLPLASFDPKTAYRSVSITMTSRVNNNSNKRPNNTWALFLLFEPTSNGFRNRRIDGSHLRGL